jgi:thiol-disulfide isomerase/thioredoxin
MQSIQGQDDSRDGAERRSGLSTEKPASHSYRIDRPTLPILMSDLRIPASDPGPGDRVPPFDLPTTSGGRFTSDSLRQDGRPLLLVFGSLTCPVTESAGPGLIEVHELFGGSVRFVVVDVREAHPGSRFDQPETMSDKVRHADALAQHHGFPFEVAVDDLAGGLHRAFGTRPSSAYLIDTTGRILFRAHWSNATEALREALSAVTAGQAPPRPAVGRTLPSMLKMVGYADLALASAGRGAGRDMWRVAPPFAGMIVASRLFGFLPRGRRGLPAALLLAAVVAALLGAAGTMARSHWA